MTEAAAAAVPARPRRGYIDWMRGLAVLIMIEAHTFDAWTRLDERGTLAYWFVVMIGGWGAPIFLFLAGVSVALASGGRERKGLDSVEAARPMAWRGVQIFGLALLFRVQAWLLSPGATLYGILKVDILNIMGPAIALAALVWGRGRSLTARFVWLSAIAILLSLLTPLVRSSTALAALPDPLEWYLRPWAGRTTFTFFPWAGFVFAGAALGVMLDRARDAAGERRFNWWFGIGGVLIASASYASSYLPSPYASSSFWTSSPAFFFLRVGVLIVLVALSYLWGQRPWAQRSERPRFSPLQQFGRTSLFIYWIHVEMVYGILSYPLHKNLALWQALIAYLLFTLFLFWLSMLKTRLADRWSFTLAAGRGARTAA